MKTSAFWNRLSGSILTNCFSEHNSTSTEREDPNVFEHLIHPELKGLDGLALLIDEMRDNRSMRSALLLRAATVLRERLQALPYETSAAEPVTIEAQDALVLLNLLLNRLG